METAFSPPTALVVAAAGLGIFFTAILPTCLYLYVEPRGRLQWAAEGDTPATRRAPWLVRATAWLSFLVGQLALPWLLIPAACAVLLYLQAELGAGRPIGLTVTGTLGLAALVQSLLALRLVPLGIRMLSRDARAGVRASAGARTLGLASAIIFGGCVVLGWAVATLPSFVHPWLRVVLVWAALRPVMAYAALCLLQAWLLGRCARALAGEEAVK